MHEDGWSGSQAQCPSQVLFAGKEKAPRFGSVIAFCAFDCSPGMLPLLFSLLFGLNMIGAVFSVWGDEPRALRVLACVELVPVLTLVASVGEQMAGLLVDGTSAYGMPEVVLLAALDGCSVLALFLRAFVTRGRYVEESREEKCVLVSPESLAEQWVLSTCLNASCSC